MSDKQKALFDNRKTDKIGQRTMFDDIWQAAEAVERSKKPKKRSMLDFPEKPVENETKTR